MKKYLGVTGVLPFLIVSVSGITGCNAVISLNSMTNSVGTGKSSGKPVGGGGVQTPVPGNPVANIPVAAVSIGKAELPRVYLNTTYRPAIGKSIAVKAGEDLQAAIDQASPGDEIVLQAGATFTAPTHDSFHLRNKPCAMPDQSQCMIIIRSSDMSAMPEGVRVGPAQSGSMPKLLTKSVAPALSADSSAHHYRVMGIEIEVNSDYLLDPANFPGLQLNYELVSLGTGDPQQDTLDKVPHDLILDRMYIHGHDMIHAKRGIGLNSAFTAIIDSYISDIHGKGQDTQAICGWNGPGPFKINNNFLEGSGENVMFGAGDPIIPGINPSDIEFRYNHVFKPVAWKPS